MVTIKFKVSLNMTKLQMHCTSILYYVHKCSLNYIKPLSSYKSIAISTLLPTMKLLIHAGLVSSLKSSWKAWMKSNNL